MDESGQWRAVSAGYEQIIASYEVLIAITLLALIAGGVGLIVIVRRYLKLRAEAVTLFPGVLD